MNADFVMVLVFPIMMIISFGAIEVFTEKVLFRIPAVKSFFDRLPEDEDYID